MASAFVVTGLEHHNIGDLNAVFVDGHFSADYKTGGDTITAAKVGLAGIKRVLPLSGQTINGEKTFRYDDTNRKLLLYTTVGTEAADASNQSTVAIKFLVLGF